MQSLSIYFFQFCFNLWGEFKKTFSVGSLMLLLGGLLSCGGGVSMPIQTSDTACASNVAQIQVGDGFFRILCGCIGAGEASGTVYGVSVPLTCHLPTRDARVYFWFLNNFQSHQLVGRSGSLFVPSSVVDPNSGMLNWVHVVEFPPVTATHAFLDVFTGLTGTLFVP